MPQLIYRLSLAAVLAMSCTSVNRRSSNLAEPTKGCWFLSEKFPYQFLRVELYPDHMEGLPSLTMEFRIRAESQGATWTAAGEQVMIRFVRPNPGRVILTPVTDRKAYRGRYAREALELPLIEVKVGGERMLMHYTESEAEMDRLLRQKNKLRLDVVWGPTTPEVMEEMFRLTKPPADDVLFDLGCGDARILIAAARRFGTRAVGYDLDTKLLEKGRNSAQQYGVAGLIELHSADLFTADLSEATIVALYLSDRINSKLKAKFFRELKAGTRIVSHNWHMGDWLPDQRVFTQDKTRVVYYWVMPANFSGTWVDEQGNKLTIRQRYQMAEVSIGGASSETQAKELRITGFRLRHPDLGTLELKGETLTATRHASAPRVFRRLSGSMEPLAI
jgi:SAM-dependent methyltransferase